MNPDMTHMGCHQMLVYSKNENKIKLEAHQAS